MLKAKRYALVLFVMIVGLCNLSAQSDLHIKLSSVAFDFQSEQNSSIFLFEPGIVFSYEYFLRDRSVSNRFTQGLRLNERREILGFTSAKLQISIYQKWKTDLNIGAGVGIAYLFPISSGNKTSDLPDSGKEKFTFNDVFLSGGIEYNLFIDRNIDFSVSIDHFYPAKAFVNVGIRYWISKKVKKRYKCLSCPDWG